MKMKFLFLIWIAIGCTLAMLQNERACNCVCGIRGARKRIISGDESTSHEFGWIVALRAFNQIYCGGSLITHKHVLSAAHCFKNVDINWIQILLGGHNATYDYSIVRFIKFVDIHSYYNNYTEDHDIALIELDRSVEFDAKVQPVCLPKVANMDYAGQLGLVAGWGQVTETNKTKSQELRQVIVPVWSQKHCFTSAFSVEQITSSMMCAGYMEGAKDACGGDSGGPMMFEGSTGSMEVIGIVSWGIGCGRYALPGIYTRVSNFLSWIHERLNGECVCSPKKGRRTNFVEKIFEYKMKSKGILK